MRPGPDHFASGPLDSCFRAPLETSRGLHPHRRPHCALPALSSTLLRLCSLLLTGLLSQALLSSRPRLLSPALLVLCLAPYAPPSQPLPHSALRYSSCSLVPKLSSAPPHPSLLLLPALPSCFLPLLQVFLLPCLSHCLLLSSALMILHLILALPS